MYSDDPSKVTKVVWYFVPSSNPNLGIENHFYSRIWDRKEVPPDPIGEAYWPHPYSKGLPPYPVSVGGRCGTPEQWRDGCLTTDPIPGFWPGTQVPVCCSPPPQLVGGGVALGGYASTPTRSGGYGLGGQVWLPYYSGGYVVGGHESSQLDGGYAIGGQVWTPYYAGGYAVGGEAYSYEPVGPSGGYAVGGDVYAYQLVDLSGGVAVGGEAVAYGLSRLSGGYAVGGSVDAVVVAKASGGVAIGGVAVVDPGTIVLDTFTASNGTLVPPHVPDIRPAGSVWQAVAGQVQIQGNRATWLAGASGGSLANAAGAVINAGRPNFTVTMPLYWTSLDGSISWGLLFRFQDINNFFALGLNNLNEEVFVYQIKAGVGTVVGSFPPDNASSGEVMTLILNGAQITGKYDDQEITLTNTFLAGVENVGFYVYAGFGMCVDNFTVHQ